MSKITKIEIQKRNKERVNLFLDGEYAFSISAELVYKEGLKVNSEINEEKIKSIAESENYIKCKESALRMIERNFKTEKEVKDKLKLKGYDDDSIENSVRFLKEYNFVNDRAYTKAFINDKLKTMGSQKIKYSLIQKGIAKEVIEEELSDLNKENEKSVALNIAKKKLSAIKNKESDKYKISGKLYRFLISKGYESNIINDIVKEVMSLEEF
ncbi:recombination regulator RecX [uncultured Clostridium sp.]|uniref:recombination regulator RecX n=1 Tax=uncultured Clostridium sp. TaxID=59620 RepID=UPI0028E5D8E9|nr:recombination regulator RecX [uncultured Clostridium sp.]